MKREEKGWRITPFPPLFFLSSSGWHELSCESLVLSEHFKETGLITKHYKAYLQYRVLHFPWTFEHFVTLQPQTSKCFIWILSDGSIQSGISFSSGRKIVIFVIIYSKKKIITLYLVSWIPLTSNQTPLLCNIISV